MNALQKFNKQFKSDFTIHYNDVVPQRDKFETLGGNSNQRVFDYLVGELKATNGTARLNTIEINSQLRKDITAYLQNTNNTVTNRAISSLIKLDILRKTKNNNEYFVNPCLVYKGSNTNRIGAITNYYDETHRPDTNIFAKCEECFGNMDEFKAGYDAAVDAWMSEEGLASTSTDSKEIENL